MKLGGAGSSNQRPNSSKPILKGSFNNETNASQGNEVGPMEQLMGDNKSTRPSSQNPRPSSPGTGKIVKASLGDSSKSSATKGKPRLRSASPAGSNVNNNSQISNTAGQNNSSVGTAFLSKNAAKISAGIVSQNAK